jgi:hypothetical protein
MRPSLVPLYATAAGLLLCAGFLTSAAEDSKPAEPSRETRMPLRGTIVSIDAERKTFTMSGRQARVIQTTAATKYIKGSQPATFADLKVGEEIGGNIKRTAEGKLEAVSVRIGPKPEADPPAPRKE